MKSKISSIVLIVILTLISGAAIFARPATRIKFRRGATSATATGSLRNYRDAQKFVIKLRGGQTLRTEQIGSDSAAHYITVYITDPRGESVGDSDASCNNRKEISPTVAGDYTIEVTECRKADAWRGSFTFKISAR